MTSKRSKKPYWEMTTRELASATAEFEEAFVIDKARPLTAQEQAEWEQARAKPTRSCFRAIRVNVEKELLAQVDALAKKRGVPRDHLIRKGLQALLAAEEAQVGPARATASP
jgi:hypothetical protein